MEASDQRWGVLLCAEVSVAVSKTWKAAAHYRSNAFKLAPCALYESTNIKGGFT